MKKLTAWALALCACAAFSVTASANTAEYQITVNTLSLVGNSNGPYWVDFQMNSGGGPFSNTATVTNFNFGGGAASTPGTAVVYSGNPTGDLSTGFSLTANPNTSAFNEIAQQFLPGATLTFDVTLTLNGGVHAPDNFVFSIDDGSTNPIATTGPAGVELATLAVNQSDAVPAVSVNTYSPLDSQYASLATVSIQQIPEPSTWATAFVGFAVLVVGLRLRHRRA